jgi:hypothetical protein
MMAFTSRLCSCGPRSLRRLRAKVVCMATVGLWMVVCSSAFASGPLLESDSCVNEAPSARYISLHAASGRHVADPYEVIARSRDLPYARRLLARLRTYPMWEFDKTVFELGTGHRVDTLSPPSPRQYFQIYVVDGADLAMLEADGLDARYCGASGSDAAVVAAGASPSTAVHEVFHAFQDGAAGTPLDGSWWGEATAEWGSLYAGVSGSLDDAFLGHPEQPLALQATTGPDADHQYGAFRFVQWLAHHAPRDTFTRILAWPFVQLGHGSSDAVLRLLEQSETREGRSLPTDLGRFWADHLKDDGALGPAAASSTLTASIGSASDHADVADYAAKLIKIDADPSAVSIHVVITQTQGELYVAAGGGTPQLQGDTYDKTFCTDGNGTPWPGSLGVAYTAHRNGGTLDVNTTTSDDPESCQTPTQTTPSTPPPVTTTPPSSGGSCGIAGFYGMGDIQTPPVYVSGTVTCIGGPHIIGLDVSIWCGDTIASTLNTTGSQPQIVDIPLNSGGSGIWDVTNGGTTFEVTFAVTSTTMSGTVTMENGPCPRSLGYAATRS